MLNVTAKFRQEWYKGEIPKLCFADITLEDETELNLTNVELWAGGFSIDNAVSEDDSFTALGSAIIGSASIIINNIDETYSDYDFMNASVILYVGLDLESNNQVEKIKVGTYHVDNPHYNGSTITLDLLDNMEQFDRPYTTSLTYPATLDEIVHDACTKCGVAFSNLSENFPNYDYEVAEKPSGEDTTYREVLSWAATIAGCFCKCDVNGKLELKWFDISTLEDWENSITDGGTFSPWNNPSSIDGGSFNPWDTGAVLDGGSFTDFPTVHYISSLYSQNICVDDTVITGVRILVKTDSDDENEAIKEFFEDNVLLDVSDYIIEISDNPFITVDTAQDVLNYLASQLIGVKFRKLSISHKSDPIIEAGDIAVVIDRKARQYPTLITHVSFTIGSSQTLICGSETPARNKSTRFSNDVKNFVAGRKELLKERTSWQAAETDLSNRITTANGLYTTDVQTSSGVIHYLHNKGPNGTTQDHSGLDASDIRIMISDVGITMTANGTAQTPTWYGLTVDGNFLANIINTISLFFDNAHGGTLTLGGSNNVSGKLRIVDASGTEIGKWDKDGIVINKGAININNNFGVNANGDAFANSINIGSFEVVYAEEEDPSTGISYIIDGFKGGNKAFDIADVSQENKIGIIFDPKGYFELTRRGTYASNADYVQLLFNDSGGTSGTSHHLTALELWYGLTTANTSKKVDLCATSYVFKVYRKQYGDYPIEFGWDGKARFDGNVTLNASLSVANTATVDNLVSEDGITVRGATPSTFRDVQVNGDAYVTGTKTRLVATKDYSYRLLYAYETPTPMFGDIGEGVIGDDGLCYIIIDPVFAQTILTAHYQVFLQKYGDGDIFVKERHGGYFIVQGTPNMSFGWEIKARQLDYEMKRLDKKIDTVNIVSEDYGDLAQIHIKNINTERIAK